VCVCVLHCPPTAVSIVARLSEQTESQGLIPGGEGLCVRSSIHLRNALILSVGVPGAFSSSRVAGV
jgi:hypothetical protein